MSINSCVRVYTICVESGFRYREGALSAARREKIDRIKSPEARELSAAADLALDFALARNVPGYAPPPDLSYDEKGRPSVPGAYVSISHTRGLAACAISDAPVGLDVEWERPMNEKIARRALSPDEIAAFLASDGQSEFLLMKWVAKEAYLKLTGEGIAGGMHKYTEKEGLILDANGLACARVVRPVLAGYRIAVCQDRPFTCELISVPLP
jgi:4'-phosphopantetheinyl transferase